jgi:prevent-host-death family protein
MERVSISELKKRYYEFLDRAHAGEIIEITLRGRPIAKMVQPSAEDIARLSDG